jgi:hypothetical protein
MPGEFADQPDGETFSERVQYMFRSNQLGTPNGLPAQPNPDDEFTDGGGPAFVANVFQGSNAAFLDAQAANGAFSVQNALMSATHEGEHRIGHEEALQRSSRAADGTPLHIRMDGTGFDNFDVPGGSKQPKLQFTAFIPTAEFFRKMRADAAALDLQEQFGVNPLDNGLERFMTATRRQNFLVPPRRTRAFPLLELSGAGSTTAPAQGAPSAATSRQAAPAMRTVSASTRPATITTTTSPTTTPRTGSGSSRPRSGGSSGGRSRSGPGR